MEKQRNPRIIKDSKGLKFEVEHQPFPIPKPIKKNILYDWFVRIIRKITL